MPPRPKPRRPGATLPPTADGGFVGAWLSARASAYRWPCPQCPCQTNLRGLLRETCSHCGHQHQPPEKE
jgi:hypothetical protein